MAAPDHPSTGSHARDGDVERARLEALLAAPRAIRSVFQPVVALATGHVAGYEALARFPAAGDVNPGTVFAHARRCGLAPDLESRAIRTALRSAVRRPRGTWLAVNV